MLYGKEYYITDSLLMTSRKDITVKNIVPLLCAIGLSFLCLLPSSHARVMHKEITYKVGDQQFTGYMAWDDSVKGKRPGILVVHEWWGHNPYARKRADMLASLGYTAFALDMYGTGKLAAHPKDAKAFMMALMSDIHKAEARFDKAHEILKSHATTDSANIAAIGYCMGGAIILHAARTGKDLKAVVSFHGSLGAKTSAPAGSIKPEILVLTGASDPFIPQKQIDAFKSEMDKAGAKYEIKVYPGIKHSFTNPDADKFAKKFNLGALAYDKLADDDSWRRMQEFLAARLK